MFIATKESKGRRYSQLVESFRRPDGKPTHRVIAHLGQLSDLELLNWQTLLGANRKGKAVVMRGEGDVFSGRVRANLRFANVAAALRCSEFSGIRDALTKAVPHSAAHASVTDVLLSLVVQRCVDPGSKLSAVSWYPTTALPELLALAPTRFNNTRVHRALDTLHACTAALKDALRIRRAETSPASFSTLFVDLTDTWFEGRGPELAKKRKTKAGHVRRKIGISLLCDSEGYPLDWEVVPGTEAESVSLCRIMRANRARAGASESTIVCDRALGKTCFLLGLLQDDIRFLIPITKDQFESYGATVGIAQRFDDLDGTVALDRLKEMAIAEGMTPFSSNGYVRDMGRVTPCRPSAFDGELEPLPPVDRDHPLRSDLRLARLLEEEAASGQSSSFSHAAAKRGLSAGQRSRLQSLATLAPAIRDRIEAGEGAALSITRVLEIAKRDQSQQLDAFDAALKKAPAKPPQRRPPRSREAAPAAPTSEQAADAKFRCILCFNPDLFIEQRAAALRARAAIEHTAATNASNTKLSLADKRAAIERALREASLIDSYDVHTVGRAVTVTLKPDAWRRSRRRDGFSILIAHPAISADAVDLARLYRQRHRIERNFQTIKSVIQLRPVWHRADAKVEAHVTLCVLALWLQRTLDQQLQRAGAEIASAACALEFLSTCHLNMIDIGALQPLYTLTTPTPTQTRILAALGLADLGSDDTVSAMLTPR